MPPDECAVCGANEHNAPVRAIDLAPDFRVAVETLTPGEVRAFINTDPARVYDGGDARCVMAQFFQQRWPAARAGIFNMYPGSILGGQGTGVPLPRWAARVSQMAADVSGTFMRERALAILDAAVAAERAAIVAEEDAA